MSSPPVPRRRACADPDDWDVRIFRARRFPQGLLAFAASFSLLGVIFADSAAAQFPIRQLPAKGSGFGVQGSGSSQSGKSGSELAQPQSPPHPAVARVVVPEKDAVSYGSGTLIDARGQFGLVVTNWHVVRDAAGQITVEFPDGFKSPAQVVKTDKDWDLAALSVYRPKASPLPVTSTAPQPGDWLTIAGYGGGDYRTAGGQCTQYLAPGIDFPHEMVEIATEARQGDSGGPIVNQRGELAGVLFGSGPGYTSGSYGGRVLKFLATVVPGGTPGSDEAPAPSTDALAGGYGAVNRNAAGPLDPSRPTALHEMKPPATPPLFDSRPGPVQTPAPVDTAALTPARTAPDDPLLSPPPRNGATPRFAPASPADDREVDSRVAVSPGRLPFNDAAIASAAVETAAQTSAVIPATLAPRFTPEATTVDLNRAPPDQLLAAAWKQIGGKTFIDQAKTVLAGIGILSLLVIFWRVGRQREPEHEEE